MNPSRVSSKSRSTKAKPEQCPTQASQRLMLRPKDIESGYGLSKSTQAKNRMAGTFAPFIKRGRSVYVMKADLDEWLLSLKRKSTLDGDKQCSTPPQPPAAAKVEGCGT